MPLNCALPKGLAVDFTLVVLYQDSEPRVGREAEPYLGGPLSHWEFLRRLTGECGLPCAEGPPAGDPTGQAERGPGWEPRLSGRETESLPPLREGQHGGVFFLERTVLQGGT